MTTQQQTAYYAALTSAWNAQGQPASTSGAPITAGMTTAQKITAVNSWMVAGPQLPIVVPTYKIYNAIDPTEWGTLSAAQQQQVRDILTMGTVDASSGTNVRAVLVSVFTGKPTTIAGLTALANSFKPALPWWQANAGLVSPVSQADCDAAGLV